MFVPKLPQSNNQFFQNKFRHAFVPVENILDSTSFLFDRIEAPRARQSKIFWYVRTSAVDF